MYATPQNGGPAQDAALTRAAQAGDVSAPAVLLERHRPGMRAVAVSPLGPGADVDDVMQDAALVALRRIVDVRDPRAVGAWPRLVVRNSCRTLLRASRRVEPVADVPLDACRRSFRLPLRTSGSGVGTLRRARRAGSPWHGSGAVSAGSTPLRETGHLTRLTTMCVPTAGYAQTAGQPKARGRAGAKNVRARAVRRGPGRCLAGRAVRRS